jgi:putative transposase
VRQLAAAIHSGPGGQQVRVSYQSINRWKRAYLDGGFEAPVPAPRQATPRTPAEVLELAAALKRENPERTAAQVQRILRATSGWAPSDRTLQRLFGRRPCLPRPHAGHAGRTVPAPRRPARL